VGSLNIPIWQGAGQKVTSNRQMPRSHGGRRKQKTRSVAYRVRRNAWLDLQAATTQVEVAEKNSEVTQDNLAVLF
jgi:hypothetical protein